MEGFVCKTGVHCMAQKRRCMAHGRQFMAFEVRCMAHGSRCMAFGTRCMARGGRSMARVSVFPVHDDLNREQWALFREQWPSLRARRYCRAHIGHCGPWCLPWHADEPSVKHLATSKQCHLSWVLAEPRQPAAAHYVVLHHSADVSWSRVWA